MAKNLLNGAIIRDKVTREVLTCIGNGLAVKEDGTQVKLRDEMFYTVLKEGMDTDIPTGYSICDGILLKDGSPATQQGGLVLVKIIAKTPGHLLVTANKQESTVEVFSYSPLVDEFKKLTGPVDDRSGLIGTKLTDNLIIFPTIRTKEYELKDEDGQSQSITELLEARLNVYSATVNAIVAYEDTSDYGVLVNGRPEFTAVHKTNDQNKVFYTQIVYSSKTLVECLSDEDETVTIKETDNPHIIRFFLSAYEDGSTHINYGGDFTLKGADDVYSITESDDRSILVKAGNIIYYTNDGGYRKVMNDPEVQKTDGYDYLLECKTEHNSLSFVLSNKDYEICVIKSEISDDRGPVVSVEFCKEV